MATVRVTDEEIRINLGPLEQFAGVHKGDVVIKLDDVEEVEAVPVARSHVPSIHFPGIDIPGLAKIGKFVKTITPSNRTESVFAAAHGSRPGYVITTRSGNPFVRVVVSTPPVLELDRLAQAASSS